MEVKRSRITNNFKKLYFVTIYSNILEFNTGLQHY